MTSDARLEELKAAARDHRERVSSSIAPRSTTRPTTAGRLRQLEQAYEDTGPGPTDESTPDSPLAD